MKRAISLVLCAAVFFLSINPASLFKAQADTKPPVVDGVGVEPLRFERKGTTGYLSVQDRKFVLGGKKQNPSNPAGGLQSDWVTSYGITGRNLTDFTLKYIYTTNKTNWVRDLLILRSPNGDMNRSAAYVFGVQGDSYAISGTAAGQHIWFIKDPPHLVSAAPTEANGAIADMKVAVAKSYNVEITAKGNKFLIYFYEVGTAKPASPTLSYTDPDNKYPAGDIGFACYDGEFAVSGMTLTDDSKGETIVQDYVPSLYNASSLDTWNFRNGVVEQSGAGTRISSKSPFLKDTNAYTRTNGLLQTSGGTVKNFNMRFLYTPTQVLSNEDKVVFNSAYSEVDAYSLSVHGADNGAKLALNRDGAQVASTAFIPEPGVDYRIEILRNEGQIDVWVYKDDTQKPASPTLSYLDSDELGYGDVYFSTASGDFKIRDITVEAVGDYGVPTPLYSADFEDGMGDVKVTASNTEKSGIFQEFGNNFLRVIHDGAGDGNASITFGPTGVSNFTFNMEVRILEMKSAYWNCLLPKFRAQGTNFIQARIYPNGSTIETKGSRSVELGRTGPAGQGTTSPYPHHDPAKGIAMDGEWHKVSVVADGWTYSLFIDGIQILETTDTVKTLSNGGFALGGWGASFEVDNIRVYQQPYVDLEYTAPTQPTGLLYENNFNSGTPGDVVITDADKVNSGIVTDEDGTYMRVIRDNKGDGNARITFGPTNIADFTMNMDVRILEMNSSDWNCLLPQAHTSGTNSIQARIYQNGSTIESKANPSVEFARTGPARSGQTSASPSPYPNHDPKKGIPLDGEWHKISFVGDGNNYSIYIDGVEILKGEDTVKLYKKGGFALGGWGVSYEVDNIRIYGAPYVDLEYTAPTQPTGLLYENNFDSGDAGDVVITHADKTKSGIVKDSEGTYMRVIRDNKGDGNARITFGPTKIADFTMNMDVRILEMNSSDWNCLLPQAHTSGTNSIQARIYQNGSTIESKANTSVEFARTGPARSGQTSASPSPYPNHDPKKGLSVGEWHKVSFVGDGDTYAIYIDGVEILKGVDTVQALQKGGFALGGWGVNYEVDNIRIYGAPYVDLEWTARPEPEGQLYTNNFEDGTLGDVNITVANMEKSGLMTENGNTFLRLVHNGVGDGSLRFTFGPNNIRNFTMSMDVRLTELKAADWHWISVRFRKSGSNNYEAQIFRNGSDFAVEYPLKGYTNSTRKLGMTGPSSKKGTSPNPNHDHKMGIGVDDEWHKISIVADGFKYSLYIDGILILQATDPDQLFVKGGFVGGGWGVSYDVDNISVSSALYYDLQPHFSRKGPVGVIFSKDFEDNTMNGLTLVNGNKDKSKIMTENGNRFLRLFKDDTTGGGNILMQFGPKNVRDFDLSARIRVKWMPNVNWCYISCGFHADPTSPKYDTYWTLIGGRGSAIASPNTPRQWGLYHYLATTGINMAGGNSTVPTDNRAYGIRPDGKFHDVKLSVRGYAYTLTVDGEEYISATDENRLYEKGVTFFGGLGVNYDVDDILLTNFESIQGSPNTGETQGFEYKAIRLGGMIFSSTCALFVLIMGRKRSSQNYKTIRKAVEHYEKTTRHHSCVGGLPVGYSACIPRPFKGHRNLIRPHINRGRKL